MSKRRKQFSRDTSLENHQLAAAIAHYNAKANRSAQRIGSTDPSTCGGKPLRSVSVSSANVGVRSSDGAAFAATVDHDDSDPGSGCTRFDRRLAPIAEESDEEVLALVLEENEELSGRVKNGLSPGSHCGCI